jgi:hypothetical protein
MAADCVNDGVELITDRHSYDACIRIYQHILITSSSNLSQAQVTIRVIPQIVRTEEENSEHLSSRRI